MIDLALSRIATKIAVIPADEERELIAQAQAGDQAARDRVILAHVRLAVGHAMKFRRYGIPVDDLVHEAVVGLIKALDGFDLAQPVRFSTYAIWSLKAQLANAVLQSTSIVRMSGTTKAKRLFFMGRSVQLTLERDGRLSKSEIDRAMAAKLNVSLAAVEAMRGVMAGDLSLNEPIGNSDDPVEHGDVLPDRGPNPAEIAERNQDSDHRRTELNAALWRLSDRERQIVTARHYAEDGEEATLQELGDRFGLSKERIRQIEGKALAKLRADLAPQRESLAIAA